MRLIIIIALVLSLCSCGKSEKEKKRDQLLDQMVENQENKVNVVSAMKRARLIADRATLKSKIKHAATYKLTKEQIASMELEIQELSKKIGPLK